MKTVSWLKLSFFCYYTSYKGLDHPRVGLYQMNALHVQGPTLLKIIIEYHPNNTIT